MNTASPISALSICKSAVAAANEGRMSQFALADLMQTVADTHFHGSIAKMLELDAMGRAKNEFGAAFLAPRSGYVSASQEAELQKREGYDKRSPKRKTPDGARAARGTVAADGDELDRDGGDTGGKERWDNTGEINRTTGDHILEGVDNYNDDDSNNTDAVGRALKTDRAIKRYVESGDSYDVAVTKFIASSRVLSLKAQAFNGALRRNTVPRSRYVNRGELRE
jgi:hypothetical protein